MKKISKIVLLLSVALLLLSGSAMAFGIGITLVSEPVMMALFGSGMIGLASITRKTFLDQRKRKPLEE